MSCRGGRPQLSMIFSSLASPTALLFLCCLTAGAGYAQANAPQKGTPELPGVGDYKIDPDHSFAYFSAWHHIVGRVRGRFDKVTGTIAVSPDPAACAVDVTIDVSTINTQVAERDKDLQSPAYFDVKNFPTMTYRGRGIRRAPDGHWVMDGSLTMHGVTRTVPLTFRFNGTFADTRPGRPKRVAFHGDAAVKRAEFGIGARDNAREVSNATAPDVDIEIDVEADSVAAAS